MQVARRVAAKWMKPVVGERVWGALRRFELRIRRLFRRWRFQEAQGSTSKLDLVQAEQAREPTSRLDLVEAARASGLALPQHLHQMLPELDQLLPTRRRPRVAILGGQGAEGIAKLIRQCYPGTKINAVPTNCGDSALHVNLAVHGPYDAIIDAALDRSNPAQLYRDIFFHLRRGGQLGLAAPRTAPHDSQGLWPLISRLIELKNARGDLSPENADEAALSEATSRVVITENYLLATNGTASLAKLRESEIAQVLDAMGDRIGTVLDDVKGETFQPENLIRDHRRETTIRQQHPLEVPTLALREYYDVMCLPGQVVIKDNLLLPESYRHFLYPRLVNHVTIEIAPRFAQVRLDKDKPTQLAGSYFHFDSEWPGHYGHVLSEQMSRLWGWEAAKARHPDLKVLLGKRPGASGVQSFEAAILDAVGVASADIMLVDGPVRVERLVAATPMFSMPDYVSPRIAPIWNVIGLTVGAQADGRPLPKRFFCGRNKKTRLCLNSDAVEEVFARAGFEILYPADLPFSSQVALFQQADVVAGYVGSALFTLCFCAEPKRVLMVAPEPYKGNNECLIAGVRGHEMDVFWSNANGPEQNSHYYFDFEREGHCLREVLADLA
jgi:capsular polysaccharide biosynthesis protein